MSKLNLSVAIGNYDRARALFDGPHHVTVATIDQDGRPQLSVVWAKTDGDDVLFSTIKGRRKYANLTRDPRASALVFAAEDPYAYAEVRGSVTIVDDPAAELPARVLDRDPPLSQGESTLLDAITRAL